MANYFCRKSLLGYRTLVSLALFSRAIASKSWFLIFRFFCWWKIPRNTDIERKLFFSQVFSDDVFHIQFLIMYYKKILSRFLDFLPILLYHTPPNKLSLAFSIWHFPNFALAFWSPSHESAFNYFRREISTACVNVCLAPRSVTSVITKKGRDSRQVRKLNNYISSIWCLKLL